MAWMSGSNEDVVCWCIFGSPKDKSDADGTVSVKNTSTERVTLAKVF